MIQFIKLTEHNDHEGETWHFWLQVDGNEEQLSELRQLIFEWENHVGEESPYELADDDDDTVLEWEVDVLVKHTDSGYMAYHTRVTGRLTLSDELRDDRDDGLDALYKGGIVRMFVNDE